MKHHTYIRTKYVIKYRSDDGKSDRPWCIIRVSDQLIIARLPSYHAAIVAVRHFTVREGAADEAHRELMRE
jgi:hypothetical protein